MRRGLRRYNDFVAIVKAMIMLLSSGDESYKRDLRLLHGRRPTKLL